MKKLALIVVCFLISSCGREYQFPSAVTENAVTENAQVVFSPTSGKWNDGSMADDRIVFTKHISPGSGSYSEYVSPRQKLYLSSTYEFLIDGRLIGYSEHDLKFYEVRYQNGVFVEKKLNPQEVRALFPGLDVILLSSADNQNTIQIKKKWFGPQTFLLLNDTDTFYYKYSFEKFKNAATPFKSAISIAEPIQLVFSHYGSRDAINPPLFINISKGV